MTGITKRNDGRYSIRITINGVRIQKYARHFKNAVKILRDLKRINYEREDNVNKPTIANWLNQWYEIYKKPFLQEKTTKDLLNYINEISKKIGNLKVDAVSTIELQSYLNQYPKSRKKEMITLYLISALKKAYETGTSKNTSYLGIVKDRKIKSRRSGLTFEEQTKLVNAIKNTTIEQPIMFYLMTGARKNELIQHIEDISGIDNYIKVHGTKTEKSILRKVKVSEKYKQYILGYISEHRMLSAEWVDSRYKKLCKEIGIPSGLHRLRHTFASNMRVMGIDAKQTQEWLGHEDITTTLNIYTDIDESTTKERLISLYNDMYLRG